LVKFLKPATCETLDPDSIKKCITNQFKNINLKNLPKQKIGNQKNEDKI
jgi:hypothetical protein